MAIREEARGPTLRRHPSAGRSAAPPAAPPTPLRDDPTKMSLSSAPAGGKGVDAGAVDTYDSGDEWDIGVGNLIIDLDADLEKDKLEMSSSKEGGAMGAPPSAVAALPDNIKFVSPVAAVQGKESKSKSKRSKNSKDSAKGPGPEGAKKEGQSRGAAEPPPHSPGPAPAKGADKCSKSSRALPAVKKDKDLVKAKKDKLDVMGVGDDPPTPVATVPLGAAAAPFEGPQGAEGNMALDSTVTGPSAAMTTEEVEDDCRNLKKVGTKVGLHRYPAPPHVDPELCAPPAWLWWCIFISCEVVVINTTGGGYL